MLDRLVEAAFAAFVVAYLRELRKGNQAAAVAKIQGLREGLRADLRPGEVLTLRPVGMASGDERGAFQQLKGEP